MGCVGRTVVQIPYLFSEDRAALPDPIQQKALHLVEDLKNSSCISRPTQCMDLESCLEALFHIKSTTVSVHCSIKESRPGRHSATSLSAQAS